MGNFKDFDLDLRNVASGGEAEPNGLSKITTQGTSKKKFDYLFSLFNRITIEV